MQNASSMDRHIWAEFAANPEAISFEAAVAFADPAALTVESEAEMPIPEGMERERLVRVRVNQRFFRRMVMSSFNESCAVCELPIPQLLVASHIVPWATDVALRMNPRNGLCLCGTHDRAYECGLLRIERTYVMRVAVPAKHHPARAVIEWLLKFDGKSIQMPQRWLPDPDLLQRRLDMVSNPQL